MVSRIGSGSAPQPVQTSYDSAPIASDRAVVEVQPVKESVQQSSLEKQQELTKSEAKKLIEGMNNFLKSVNVQLRFKYHDTLNEYYVTIVNTETDEVVREIPPKKLLDMHAEMKRFIGLLVDHKI
ncbi:flagellar biosynthesis protein FlaG [Sporosarcina sp. P13]|uniref:flagellar protein FlaG n=1 Tax=Sporosarcina sp. P13 TaxID=2048263 RepID=UPI000C16EF7C|nr:flagellar protein FlaG [Sporosarcina sp. P13]PIC62933.1 flagellar biosynthesis protein FlaG [Sporosarcina sp. P13]